MTLNTVTQRVALFVVVREGTVTLPQKEGNIVRVERPFACDCKVQGAITIEVPSYQGGGILRHAIVHNWGESAIALAFENRDRVVILIDDREVEDTVTGEVSGHDG